jgi:hypothetical protein
MSGSQRLNILLVAAFLLLVSGGTANAFWGFGDSRETNNSGLDLEQGYDRNTVVSISGTVAVSPRPLAGGLVSFDLNMANEQIVVIMGPSWYLQDDNLDWKIGTRVTVRGSVAQGKDGRKYLLSQWISTLGGTTIELRGENGSPAWSGGMRGGQQGGVSGGQYQRGSGAAGRRGR